MAVGNRGDIVLPEVRCSELACNWIPTNGGQNATKSKFDIECQVGSLGAQRGLGRTLGHGHGSLISKGRQEVLPYRHWWDD